MEEKTFQFNNEHEQRAKQLRNICDTMTRIEERLTKLEISINHIMKGNEINVLRIGEQTERSSLEHEQIMNQLSGVASRLTDIERKLSINPYV